MNDIINGEWEPQSLGEWVDILIIRNIRMWHLQERVYHLENLFKEDRNGLESYLKDATWMNLQRNFAIDNLDSAYVEHIFGTIPKIIPQSIEKTIDTKVWEDIEIQ